MHRVSDVGLADVQAEYGVADGDVSQLIMGEQLHVGGVHSTLELAERAGIAAGMVGVDLCCYTGAGMRALVRFCAVGRMIGVDATAEVVDRGRQVCADEGLDGRISFLVGDACATGLPDEIADFVWGEDAWCYVEDKSALLVEAARLLRPGGVVAFTDWVEGSARMDTTEAERLLRFMRVPASSISVTTAVFSARPGFVSRPLRIRVISLATSRSTGTWSRCSSPTTR